MAGGLAAQEAGLADVIFVGRADHVDAPGATVHDPATSDLTDGFAQVFHELRKHKGMDEAKARAAVQTPLVYAAMLVREGHATGTVGGAVATTSDVVRTAIQVIGKAPDAAMVSSFFAMYPPRSPASDANGLSRAMVYSDCGLVIAPSSTELAAIAAQSAGEQGDRGSFGLAGHPSGPQRRWRIAV